MTKKVGFAAMSPERRQKLSEMGRKGGARTAELRRLGQLPQATAPLADAKALTRQIMKWKDE